MVKAATTPDLFPRRSRRLNRPKNFGLIHSLPVEVLAEVFQAYNALELPVPFDTVRTAHVPACILAQICQTWRAIALSLPQLWTRLVVRFPTTCDVALTRLQRASPSFPVDLFVLSGAVSGFAVHKASLKQMSHVLRQFSHIIRSFSFIAAGPSGLGPLPMSPSTYTFEHLCLWLAQPTKENPQPSPLLTHLNISSPYRDQGLDFRRLDLHGNTTIPWSQLTSLELRQPFSVRSATRLLCACTSLGTCTIQIADIYDMIDLFEDNFVLPHLHTLKIDITKDVNDEDLGFPPIFSILTLPVLKTFDISLTHLLRGELRALKSSSSPNLEHLTLTDTLIQGEAVVEFLKDMTSLSTITLIRSPYVLNEAFLDALTYRSDSMQEQLAPNLTHFLFSEADWGDNYHGVPDISAATRAATLAMVNSRCPPSAQGETSRKYLRSLHLGRERKTGEWLENDDVARCLGHWREMGMEVVIT